MSAPQPFLHLAHPDFLIVEKPAPLLIHPTRPDGTFTLLHWLQEQYPDETLAIINRLDRETSGLVLVSRHRGAASDLGKMTMRREIHKTYLALCAGQPDDSGTIKEPLARIGLHHGSRIYLKQGVHPEGAAATTHFRRIETRRHPQAGLISLVELRLETGRLHQIRVHLAHLGHPVIGDKLYGPDDSLYLEFIDQGWTPRHQSLLYLPRQALHANHLTFTWQGTPHPITSPLPADLDTFWNQHPPPLLP
jgi:23S rRNA pseudouridine1911/1915/1917 synthase